MKIMLCDPVVVDPLNVINRPGVAGAVLQSPLSLINSLSDPSVKISSKHSQSQTGRARELKF